MCSKMSAVKSKLKHVGSEVTKQTVSHIVFRNGTKCPFGSAVNGIKSINAKTKHEHDIY